MVKTQLKTQESATTLSEIPSTKATNISFTAPQDSSFLLIFFAAHPSVEGYIIQPTCCY
jgi:hypothetical protein